MNRSDFKSWGAELNTEDFACALAALGVLVRRFGFPLDPDVRSLARELLKAIDENNGLVQWETYWLHWPDEFAYPTPASTLANAWKDIQRSRPYTIRLEIMPPDQDPFWLFDQLSRRSVGARSIYLREDQPGGELQWNWPVRMSLLGDGPSTPLRTEIEHRQSESSWYGDLVKLSSIENGHGNCDFLILPHNLKEALAAVLTSTSGARADCVIVLGAMNENSRRAMPLFRALRSHLRAGGVALVNIPRKKCAEWLYDFARELSHNVPIDVALRETTARAGERHSAFLLASGRLTRFTQLGQKINALGEKMLRSPGAGDKKITLDQDTAMVFDLHDPEISIRHLGDHLKSSNLSFRYMSELDAGAGVLKLEKKFDSVVDPEPIEPQARRIRTKILAQNENREYSVRKDSFLSNTTHKVLLRIAVSDDPDSITSDKPFPMESLPQEAKEHQLTVIFTNLDDPVEPQTALIKLPNEGDSEPCEFYFHTGEKTFSMTFQILVMHQNRILQSARLTGAVAERSSRGRRDDQKIRLTIDATVRPGMEDLSGRSRYDAALVVNGGDDGKIQIATITGPTAHYYTPQDLNKEIDWFRDEISATAFSPELYATLESKESKTLLFDLAQHGVLLRRMLDRQNSLDDSFSLAKRIQILAVDDFVNYPIEFVYDRPLNPGAELCKNAAKGLKTGECRKECTASGDPGDVVCPLGFWGLSRVIERQTFVNEDAENRPNWSFTMRAEPGSNRDTLDPLVGGLIAVSQRVKDYKFKGRGGSDGVVRIQQTIKEASGASSLPPAVEDWKKWIATIKAESPSLLVLLVHTQTADNDLLEMEIGKEEWLRTPFIDKKHVRDPQTNPAPLVFLLGCETGAPKISFHDFVTTFREFGAAIVVSTGSTILGRHAVPVVQEFVRSLAEYQKKEDATFGDVMLSVRQRMTSKGILMSLCLQASGDGDWRLGKKV